jgi:HPr kinase/phosphorylase
VSHATGGERTTTVAELLKAASQSGLELVPVAADIGHNRTVTTSDLHRPGLALTGHLFHHHPDRIQVMGATEIEYLEGLSPERRREILDLLAAEGVPAFVVTRGLAVPAELTAAAAAVGTAVLQTSLSTRDAIVRLQRLLEEAVAPLTTVHGVMVDVFGVGVLLRGPSGIGKSECALELVLGGHRLVADDLVEVRLKRPQTLMARAVDVTKHHMEIRGLGIINVQDLFGVAAVRDQKRLELVVNLQHWDPAAEYDRLGIEDRTPFELLGVPVEQATIPIRPGRNLSDIVEVAARNHILKLRGVDSAGRFHARLLRDIARGRPERQTGAGLPEENEDIE